MLYLTLPRCGDKIDPRNSGEPTNFVGFRVLPGQIRVRNDNLERARTRIKQMQKDYYEGKISLEKIIQKMRSWEAHLKHGDTYKLRKKIFDSYSFSTPVIVYNQ